MSALLTRFAADRRGATSIEYAMIATGIGVAVVVVVNGLGLHLGLMYSAIGLGFN